MRNMVRYEMPIRVVPVRPVTGLTGGVVQAERPTRTST